MKNLLSNLKILIFSKWFFKKPGKKKILLSDKISTRFSEHLFSKNSYEILDMRYESINIYISLITFFKSGVINFKDNYKKNFIECVSPKIVFTAIDNNPAFYNLKNICNKPVYISVQNGMRKNSFYKECKEYIKKNKKILRADHIFLFGENEKKRFSKIIKGNIHCVGNLLNNYYSIKKKNARKKISTLMYISQYKLKIHNNPDSLLNTFKEDKRIFNHLIKFCRKKNIKLTLCSNDRDIKNGTTLESYYRKNLLKGSWIYRPQGNKMDTYTNLNKQQMVVFGYSTLGFEALSKNLKCAVFYKYFPIIGSNVKYPKSGPFWTNEKSYEALEKTLNRVISFSDKNWKRISDKYSQEILNYDPLNTKVKKILKKIYK